MENHHGTGEFDRRDAARMLAGGVGLAALGLSASSAESVEKAASSAYADIEKIEVTGIDFIDLEFPHTVPHRRNAIIERDAHPSRMDYLRLHTNIGVVGYSEPKGPRSVIAGSCFDRVKGENPFDVERIWDRMYNFNRKPVAKGEYIMAMGSIDMAVWDIIGKVLNLPVYKVLGACRNRVEVYAAGGYYANWKSNDDLQEEMAGYVEEGFGAVKMKVGGEPLAADRERVKLVREAIGPDTKLLIDANNAWKAYEAIRFIHAVEEFNPFWFEEPVVPDDFAGAAEVRVETDVPVVVGENEFTRWGARDLIMAGSGDILNLDTVKAGGITEYKKIAALASAFHIPVAPHGSPHMAIHLLASVPNTLIMETYPGVEHQYNPALPLYPVNDGYIEVPDRPGLGIDPDPDIVGKYQVK